MNQHHAAGLQAIRAPPNAISQQTMPCIVVPHAQSKEQPATYVDSHDAFVKGLGQLACHPLLQEDKVGGATTLNSNGDKHER
eukprot:6174667-Pleurochrysis_carterae.AAC.3